MNVPNFPVSRTFAEAVGVCELVDVLISSCSGASGDGSGGGRATAGCLNLAMVT